MARNVAAQFPPDLELQFNQTSSKPNLPLTELVVGQLAHMGGKKLAKGRLCLM